MMPIDVGHLVTPSFSRTLSIVFSGTGDAVTPFKAYVLTGSGESGQWEFLAADGGVSVFGLLGTATPAGFSPFGDLVAFRSYPATATQFFPIGDAPLTTETVVEAIVMGWVFFEDFGAPPVFAFLSIAQPGGGDRYVVASLEELTLLRKNPAFP
jgi:hypothetical protein